MKYQKLLSISILMITINFIYWKYIDISLCFKSNTYNESSLNFESKLLLEGISYVPREDRFNIYLIWFGDKLPDLYFKCLETVVYHHPNADVLLFSNDLKDDILKPIWNRGYKNVHIVKFNMTKMTENKPGHDFVIKADKILSGKNISGLELTRVHLSDFLRYFLVYNYGGFYIDTDSFVMKNMEHLRNSIGSKPYKTNNITKRFLSNSIYHFDKHHPFMHDALINYDIWWVKVQKYAPGGALMLIDLIENKFYNINYVPQREFICLDNLWSTRSLVNEDNPGLNNALKNCYTIQMLGAGRSSYVVNNFEKTFVGHIYKKFKIV